MCVAAPVFWAPRYLYNVKGRWLLSAAAVFCANGRGSWRKFPKSLLQTLGCRNSAGEVIFRNDCSRFEKRPQWFWKTTAVVFAKEGFRFLESFAVSRRRARRFAAQGSAFGGVGNEKAARGCGSLGRV